jgi:multidrug efflux pump subunit AcrB
MSRLPPLPRDSDRPVVQLGGDGGDSNQQLSFFFVQLLPGSEGPIERYRRFVEDVVKPRIESVPGVAQVEVQGGPPDDVRITLDLARAAALGIGIPDIARQAASATNVSAGQLDVGRRQYSLRYTGRYDAQDLGQLVLAWRDGQPVRLADLATVEMRPPERTFFSYQNGNPAIGLRIVRAPGANVLSTLEEVKKVVAELRDGPLEQRGLGIEQSFDASLFINRAVSLLVENLVVGAMLALLCVWWFMRDVRATVLIASTIPVCLLATFCVLDLAGRSINVISLAGLAFAVGMVVEGAIVVSGNIIRLKEGGMPIEQAAHDGTRQVVPALFASTATTIAVFLPVLFLKDVEGQIFADLALTISIAVAFSIVVAITVVAGAGGGGARPLARLSRQEFRLWRRLALADRSRDRVDSHAQAAARLGGRIAGRAAAVVLAADAEARLLAAGEARSDRRVLQLSAGHEPRGRQSRNRPHAAEAHGALHEGREGAAPQELVRTAVAGWRHDRRARHRG